MVGSICSDFNGKLGLITGLLFISTNAFPSVFEIPAGRIAADPFGCRAQFKTATDLNTCNREKLTELTNRGLHTFDYSRARERMFQFVDSYENTSGERVVDSIYSQQIFTLQGSGIPHNGVNTEHTWPQSYLKIYPRFTESKCDIHHLFPVDNSLNSQRGNRPFADCGGENSGSLAEGFLCGAGFEPPSKQKGVTARAMFYMAVTYNMPIDDTQEAILRQWNLQFPPTQRELDRETRIEQVQGNTNPFVAHPEWVELISDY